MKDLSKIIKNYGNNLEQSKFIKESSVIGAPESSPAPSADSKTPYVTTNIGSANDFIKQLPGEMRAKIAGAIKRLANLPTPEEEKVAFYKISGRNIKLEFKPMQGKEPNAKQAMFTFVENQNRAEDIARHMYEATAGIGTNEEKIFAIPAVVRQFCEETGKNPYTELKNIIETYRKQYNREMFRDIIDDMDEASTVDGRNILYAAFLVNDRNSLDPSTTGTNYVNSFLKKYNIDPTNTNGIADMLESDFTLIQNQIFVLHCTKSIILRINAILKSRGEDFYKSITSGVKGDLKLAYDYKFQAAGLLKKDRTYNDMYALMANGLGAKNFIEL